MTDLDAFPIDDVSGIDAATLAAPLAATGRVHPEQVEAVLSSDRRREHPPELRIQLTSEMMAGAAVSILLAKSVRISQEIEFFLFDA